MVSKARLDLPDPLTPVTTVIRLRGMSTSRSFRLWTRAPLTIIGRSVPGFDSSSEEIVSVCDMHQSLLLDWVIHKEIGEPAEMSKTYICPQPFGIDILFKSADPKHHAVQRTQNHYVTRQIGHNARAPLFLELLFRAIPAAPQCAVQIHPCGQLLQLVTDIAELCGEQLLLGSQHFGIVGLPVLKQLARIFNGIFERV